MKTARMFDPFWFGWFAVLMLFVSARASAQVASVCGPGKNCQARSFTATQATPNTAALMCLENSGGGPPGWGWVRNSQQLNLATYTGSRCAAGGSTFLQFDPANSLIGGSSARLVGSLFATTGLNATASFAGFPSCTATLVGRLLFDTTNNVWRYCDGAGTWQQVASAASLPTVPTVNEPTWSATSNFNAAAALEDINWLGPYAPNSGDVISKVDLTCNWATAGTGGTNGVVMAVYTAAGALQCKCSLMACTTAARVPGACSCEAGLTPGTTYVMRLHSDTDCTANPQNIVCTAVLVP